MSEDARLRWLCRRGMKELDLLLLDYLERHYPSAEPGEQEAFRRLLESQDPDIYAYMIGRETPRDGEVAKLVETIRSRLEP